MADRNLLSFVGQVLNLEEREMLLRESSLLGKYARDCKHGQTTIFDLRYSVSFLFLRVFTQV